MRKGFKIDLHLHSREESPCSSHSAESMAEAAVKWGLDAIAFTNHNRYADDARIKSLRRKFPKLKIYNGVEVSIGNEHFLCFGPCDQALENWLFGYEELLERVRSKGGFIALAHPYRFGSGVPCSLENPTHAIEIHSMNTGRDDEEAISSLAERTGAKLLHNSDAHNPEHVGIFWNLVPELPKDETGLAEMLRTSPVSGGGDKARIASHNAFIEEAEAQIREFISSGGLPEEYEKRFGRWRGYYDRARMGKSYRI